MKLFCIGISHHTANVETREQYASPFDQAAFRSATGCAETLVLATCNRVELYAAAPGEVATQEAVRWLAGAADTSEAPAFYRYESEECVQHLFRVACGLDSMVIGETEILGQAKKAYEYARETGSAGAYLHRLFQRAFRVAKQVRTRTEITRGAVSVGSVAVELAVKIFGELAGRKVLILGAGDTSERTARALVSRGVRDIRVSNRSPERAETLAAAVSGRTVSFAAWPEECAVVDVLISSTSAHEPLLTSEILAPIIRERLDRPLFIIDIAVPRDVAPEVNDLDGVYLYDIDSLQSIAEQSLALRRQQIASGEEIIAEHVRAFAGWCSSHGAFNATRAQPLADATLRASES
ncbi:MAG: glutamyl-tRNA reductase [Verrucomicrobiota bacterium]|nr:glutamyl-tRNA reductase [Verrucomicrobiota bacterium]